MWTSPDGSIAKLVLVEGEWGRKPAEASECKIRVSETQIDELISFNAQIVAIGVSDGWWKRTLDLCLLTMNEREVAKFTICARNVTFTLELVSFVFNGWIYQWDAGKKVRLSRVYKERGVDLFRGKKYKDAAHCFGKALKMVASIPIDAEKAPGEVDGVRVGEIIELKAILYNNLGAFYLKYGLWGLVADSCRKVLFYDAGNVKAHYRLAMACMKERNFEEAEKEFGIVVEFEPNNAAARDNLEAAKAEVRRANDKVNLMVKKMFSV